jgi:hypothetical protein
MGKIALSFFMEIIYCILILPILIFKSISSPKNPIQHNFKMPGLLTVGSLTISFGHTAVSKNSRVRRYVYFNEAERNIGRTDGQNN